MSDAYFRAVSRRFAELEAAIESLDRRVRNLVREGRITGVDYARGVATVDMDGLPSRDIPWVQRAGDIKDWDPPTVGERVTVVSPTGDPAQGLITPGGWSDANPAPHDRGGERFIQAAHKIVLRVGETELILEPDKATLRVGATSHVVMTPDHLELQADRIDLNP